jgi:site-specific DNA recombinase
MEVGQRAIAYVRVSVVGGRAKRGRFESPELQRQAIDAWCEQRGIRVVDEVRDLNRSGSTLTRPGLEHAVDQLLSDGADGLVVARSDRASRRAVDGLGLIDRLETSGKWIAAADGTLDTSDRVARMATTMMLAVGQNELERYREQSAVIHKRAVLEKGRHMGPAPFGYRRGDDTRLVVDDDEAQWVRHVFVRRAESAGWVQLSRELDEAGVRQRNGRTLNAHMLRRMVTHRVYVGEASHGEYVRAAAHAAIVDEVTWQAANRAIPAVASDPAPGRQHEDSLLRGLLRCSGCRYVLKRQPQRVGPARWRCRTLLTERSATHQCESPASLTGAQGAEVEREVVKQFAALAAGVGAQEAGGPEVNEVERRVVEAEALLDELSSLEMRRQLGAVRWTNLVKEARESVEQAHRDLAAARSATRRVGDRVTLEQAWDGMTTAERQESLRSVIQAVMVGGDAIDVVPVWIDADLPRRGVRDFIAHPWGHD